MAVQVDERFQGLAALQAAKDVAEQRPQVVGIDRIENGPHLRVAGDVVDAIDGAEVVIGILAALIEGQQGRVLEGEQGEGRHEGVAEGNVGAARACLGHLVKTGADEAEEGIGREILAGLAGGENHRQLLLPESQDGGAREV